MQILKGTKREITLMEWDEQLKKAEKSFLIVKNVFVGLGIMTVSNGLKKMKRK